MDSASPSRRRSFPASPGVEQWAGELSSMKFLLREVLMMRGGRRMLITVWSSSRTSGCSSQGLSEMHWEGKERKIRLHPTSQTLKRSRPCSAPKWGASQMSPKPKLCPPHLVMLLLLLQAKAKFILAPTQTHTNTELNSTKKCPIQRSQLLLAFPSPFTLCFHLGIYQ